jgi:nucleoside-diphosphate-sugar epimerase
MRTNIEGTLHVLDFARRAGCGLFVYTGSSSSYGDAPTPFHEDGPLRPSTPYAMSKQVGEMYVQASGLSHAVLRLFNVYGPGDPPGRYRNAIPNMIRALDRPDGCLRVYGREATRDFTYVDDVVRALWEAPRAAGQVVNVGTGTETPILKLAHRLLEHFRLSEACLSLEPPRPWDRVVRRCAHVGRLRALYQWVPSTPLDDGLVRTIRWMHAAGYLTRVAPV